MQRPDVRRGVDNLLASHKTLAGFSFWKNDPDGDAQRWIGNIEINGELPGVALVVKAYPRAATQKFRIILTASRCFWRLDYADDGHVNPLDSAYAPGEIIYGPHFHSWEDNRRFATSNSLPRRLKVARPLPEAIRTFAPAIRWFLAETNIFLATGEMPDLPKKDTLL